MNAMPRLRIKVFRDLGRLVIQAENGARLNYKALACYPSEEGMFGTLHTPDGKKIRIILESPLEWWMPEEKGIASAQ
jgi:hypothetical protein